MQTISASKGQRQIGGSRNAVASGSMTSSKKGRKKSRGLESQSAGGSSRAYSGGSLGSNSNRSALASSEPARSRRTVERGDGVSSVAASGTGINVPSYTAGFVHTVDIGLGVTSVVYGGLVHVTTAMAATISYGLVLLLGALAGAIGYFSGCCSRRGLRVSAIAGFLTSILNIGIIIAILVPLSWELFVGFLSENYEHLMLSEDSVKTIQGLKIPLAVIFAVLAIMEALRGCIMWGMKDTLPEQVARVAPLSRSKSVPKRNWFLSLFGFAKRKKTDDFIMFDDNASMESSLLWSQNRAQPTSDDYLEFVHEHERRLSDFSYVSLPKPPEDRTDY